MQFPQVWESFAPLAKFGSTMIESTSYFFTWRGSNSLLLSPFANFFRASYTLYFTISFMAKGMMRQILHRLLQNLTKVSLSSMILKLSNSISLNLFRNPSSLRMVILLDKSRKMTDITRRMSFLLSEFSRREVLIMKRFCTNDLLKGISQLGELWMIWVRMERMFNIPQWMSSWLEESYSDCANRLKCLMMDLMSQGWLEMEFSESSLICLEMREMVALARLRQGDFITPSSLWQMSARSSWVTELQEYLKVMQHTMSSSQRLVGDTIREVAIFKVFDQQLQTLLVGIHQHRGQCTFILLFHRFRNSGRRGCWLGRHSLSMGNTLKFIGKSGNSNNSNHYCLRILEYLMG